MPGKGPLIGIDNIYLKAQRPPDFYEKVRPMLNVGGMMEYPRGQGGIVLCNLNFKENEEVPENARQEAEHPGGAAAQPEGARSPAARA